MSLLTTMKGLPLAYNKDLQEDKEFTFDAIDTAKACIHLFTGMIRTMKLNKERMAESAVLGFTNATDAADYLVKKGVSRSSVTTEGMGGTKPVVNPKDADNNWKNRRVEFILVK